MFIPIRQPEDAPQPWEYLPAAAGKYQAGQLLAIIDGKLASLSTDGTSVPSYLCMYDITVSDSQVVPTTRIEAGRIYATQLVHTYSGAKPGVKLQVDANGLGVNRNDGNFELTKIYGNQAGDTVHGKFV